MNDTDCRPSEAKAHIIGELNRAISNCLKLSIDNLGNIEAGQGTLFFKKEDTTNMFEYNVLSSGEKEVVDILLDLYLRKDKYKDSIYIIDEPELHLNTAIQRQLLIEINKMIPENCQIWVATHSIGFLRALQDELNDVSQIIEFKEENQWAAQPYTLVPKVKTSFVSLFITTTSPLTLRIMSYCALIYIIFSLSFFVFIFIMIMLSALLLKCYQIILWDNYWCIWYEYWGHIYQYIPCSHSRK